MYVENSYLSKQLCFLFYVSSKEIIKKYTNYLKEYELTYTGYIVLMAIENDEKLNIKKPLSEISMKVYSEFDINQDEAKELIENLQNFVSKNFDNSIEK